MAGELPLKVRVDIRDLWESPKSSVQASAENLEAILGHKIYPQAQWPALWGELKDFYPDKATFVPSICRITIAWYERLMWRLENENFSEWTDQLLSHLSRIHGPKGRINLHVEPSSTPQLQTIWKINTSSFSLLVPKLSLPTQPNVESTFDRDFEAVLAPNNTSLNDDDWADVMTETHSPARRNPSLQSPKNSPVVRRLPTVDTIPRPSELLTTTAPYFLKLSDNTIQCSHEPSLQLLAAYLNKWGKPNVNDSLRRNVYNIKLSESAFFLGSNDTLTIGPHDGVFGRQQPINHTVILAFIEGVLGFKLVHTTGNTWLYKSNVLFK